MPSPTLHGTSEQADPPAVSAEVRQELAEVGRSLESAHPMEVIRWAADRYADRLTMATAFGPEGCLIIHWLAAVAPRTHVFNLDTGYQFRETLDLRNRIAERYGIDVALERPDTSVAEYERLHGGPLYRTDPDRCCGDRKLAVVRRVLAHFSAWMSGIRRDQSPDRAAAPIVGWDHKFGVVKVSPLATWTKAQVWDAIVREGVPYNLLHDQGYVSIGCAPCTRTVAHGEDERAGRWTGTAKTECGLHSRSP
ncbi:MAG: phosphoadenylyl-sulfate reductase [Planctomycetota bacterium]|nr:MAG: phosphoadenylyl-sulfate reductase [Planctomycetota bacterium]